MNFARHLLRRTIVPLSRPIILPAPTPLRALTTPIPRIVLLPRLHQTRHESTTLSTPQEPKPSYDLTFTCRPCGHRSTHSVSKQGYHYGSILITCPGCHNRHVISDHLKVFGETSRSFEEILAQSGSGETIRKYTAAQRSYEEQLAAEDTLRERGIWSEGGNHVEVLPEAGEIGAIEEGWEGLEGGGIDAEPEGELTEVGGKDGGMEGASGGVVEGMGKKEDV